MSDESGAAPPFDEDPFAGDDSPYAEDELYFGDFPLEVRYENGFCICDEGSANWFLKKQLNIEAEIARVKAQAEEIVDCLQKDRDRLQNRFLPELEQWAAQEMERRAQGKTLRLLQGTISFRTVPSRVKVADVEAAFEYARTALPDAVKTVVSLDEAAYRAAFEATGDAGMPGIEIVPERQSMSIKAAATVRTSVTALPGGRRTQR